MRMRGFVGTNMEHAMIEMAYDVNAVSTGKIFGEALKKGIPIHVLDNPETLEANLVAISAYPVVKNHIRTYVNAGYTAMIPQRSIAVENWSGQGWIVMNEETGAAGYMICGGLHGDNTMLSGGSGTTIINNIIATIEAFLYKLVPAAGSLSAGLAKLVIAYHYFLYYNLPLLFFIGGTIIGLLFVLLAITLLIHSFITPPISRIRRKSEYAYA